MSVPLLTGELRAHEAAQREADALGDALATRGAGALAERARRRLAEHAVSVSPPMGDLQVAYLLTREACGKGRYQEEVFVLARGALEVLTAALVARAAAPL
ncbi:MAG TPA: hypothetical protein VFX49_01325 [Chloroflexota bacterium]|nr:hypothetical protein [Chloroflexota bacterium]